jgi:four helix bundle protein
MTVRNYRDLIVWQKAFQLALEGYRETANFPKEEQYHLTSQMRDASVSVASNIAEGECRGSKAEFHHFLRIAHGSLRELETQILISDALGYLRPRAKENLFEFGGRSRSTDQWNMQIAAEVLAFNDPPPTAHCLLTTSDYALVSRRYLPKHMIGK